MKKIILILFAFIINLFIVNSSSAENFYIKNYDILMDVKENRDVDITETIDVYFTYPSHGIFRIIPIKSVVSRADGSKNTEYGRILNIESANLHKKNRVGNDYKIMLGSPYSQVYGPKTYKLKYTYKLGRDKLKNADEFYYNIIGTQWNTYINRVNFKIKMPKAFPVDKMGFSTGKYGEEGYNPDFLVVNTNGIEINGYTTSALSPNEGITVRIETEDKYFNSNTIDIEEIILIISGLLTLICIILWAIFGKDEPVVPIVNFYPPKNKNSAEVEVEYLGYSTEKGVSSLILYLASKGYIEIEDDGFNFKITKLKEYDGNNKAEKMMFDALFSAQADNFVTETYLKNSFSFETECIRIQNYLSKIRQFLFEKGNCGSGKLFIMLLSTILIVAALIYSIGDYSFDILFQGNSFLLLFPVIAIMVLSLFISCKKAILFGIIWSLFFGGMPLVIFLIDSGITIGGNYIVNIIEIVFIIICTICMVNMPKRSRQGRELLGQIMGFKKYMEVAESHRIQQLLDENPNYCDEVLPFAYALGVSDTWLKNLENFSADITPKYYKGTFNRNTFSHFSKSLSSAISPQNSSNGGSTGGHSSHRRSSGGGHSGGGRGGGGGGSW